MIAQDYRGQVLCGGHSMARGDSAKIIEARAVVEGFRLAVEKNWEDVVVETDAATIINHIKGIDKSWRIETIMANDLLLARSVRRISRRAIP